jgi:Uma2 family endonuclease
MAATHTLTLDEFLALPETEPASEYEDGEVIQKTTPTGWHGLVQGLLLYVLTVYTRSHPVGQAGSEVRCIFGQHRARAYVPDVVFVVSGAPDRRLTDGPFEGAPDLAVEILSPDDRMPRVMRKLRFYLENGVRLVWLIDPRRRWVLVMSAPDIARLLTEEDTLDGGDVLPEFSVPVREILPPLENAPERAEGEMAE